MTKKINYRLGIDLGATSLGWCVIELINNKPADIKNAGVRIFPDGREEKSKIPLAVKRREARSARRLRDRYLQRRDNLMQCLVDNGLMPKNINERKKLQILNPYLLRKKALYEKLSLYELGRVLFHLNQRRGFKSNRKADKKDKESSSMKLAIKKLNEELEKSNAKTIGEFLCSQLTGKNSIRFKSEQLKSKNIYDLFPDRSLYQKEFELIWTKQAEFYPDVLTDELKNQIKNTIIFYQRPLKEQEVGYCTFEDNEKRAPLALPICQKFRILQEVNNLELRSYTANGNKLTNEQKQIIKQTLLCQPELFNRSGELTFAKIRKILKLSNYETFNLESDARKSLKGNITAFRLSKKDCFDKKWFSIPDDKQEFIVEKLLSEQNENKLINWLCVTYDLPEENAKNISSISLEDGYGRLSKKAIKKLLPYLEQGFIYTTACEQAGYAEPTSTEKYDFLPYYGEVLPKSVIGGTFSAEDKPAQGDPISQYEKYYGKINNPTVHIALNQLRKFINELIKLYGHPDEIVIELARELKLGRKKQKEIEKKQSAKKKRNEEIKQELESRGIKPNYENRMKYKIWEELNTDPVKRCCPFTGNQISVTDLYSPKFEIEHILPFSKTYDNSIANKVISCKSANQYKGNRSPYEAFGNSLDGYNWNDIIARAEGLPANKKWRFQPDAMQKAQGAESDIIARQLTDTQYMSRVARQYLQFICEPNKVWSIPGRLTALLRDKWGVNILNLLYEGEHRKDRTEHRHHCIDAFVVACTTRGILQKISWACNNTKNRDRLIENMPDPIDDFASKGRIQLKNLIENMVISYKPDHKGAPQAVKNHSTIAALHEETAYGYAYKIDKKRVMLTVRKKLTDLIDKKSLNNTKKNISNIKDEKIKNELLALIEDKSFDEIPTIINNYSNSNNVKRIKIYVRKSKDTIIAVKDKSGKEYKWYPTGGNYCAEIFCTGRKYCYGKCLDCKQREKGLWKIEVISNYQAHQKDFVPLWRKEHPTAKLMMRLFINDMVAYEEKGETKICRVKKMSGNNVYLREHFIAKEEGDQLTWGASGKLLHKKKARRLSVDILGQVKDPYRKIKNVHN